MIPSDWSRVQLDISLLDGDSVCGISHSKDAERLVVVLEVLASQTEEWRARDLPTPVRSCSCHHEKLCFACVYTYRCQIGIYRQIPEGIT